MDTSRKGVAGYETAGREDVPVVNASGRRLYGVKEVAHLYGCGERTVYRLADSGRIPYGIKLGGLRRWDSVEIEDHISRGCPPVRVSKRTGGTS